MPQVQADLGDLSDKKFHWGRCLAPDPLLGQVAHMLVPLRARPAKQLFPSLSI